MKHKKLIFGLLFLQSSFLACRQLLMEFNNTDKCIYNLSEDDKDQMVMNHFENKFIHPNC